MPASEISVSTSSSGPAIRRFLCSTMMLRQLPTASMPTEDSRTSIAPKLRRSPSRPRRHHHTAAQTDNAGLSWEKVQTFWNFQPYTTTNFSNDYDLQLNTPNALVYNTAMFMHRNAQLVTASPQTNRSAADLTAAQKISPDAICR